MNYKQQLEEETTDAVRAKLKSNDSVVSGKLYKSIHCAARIQPRCVRVDIMGLKYGIYLNKGTRPHYPPVGPIRAWCKMKRSIPYKKGLEYAIVKSIGAKGTRPHPFIENIEKKNIINAATLYYINEMTKWIN